VGDERVLAQLLDRGEPTAWRELYAMRVLRAGSCRSVGPVALDLARQKGAKTVDLTSRPSREAANALYQRIGFEPRDTNVYRYSLEG
jgi:hypothetical protein